MIPDYPCERLANSPLVQVIAQVRFSPFPTLDRSRLAPFIEGVASDYPYFLEEKSVNVVVDHSGSVRNQEGEPVFRFLSADLGWSVSLDLNSMALECRRNAYEGVQDFIRRFTRLTHLLAQVNVKKQLRFGFRMVNEIRVREGGDSYAFWYENLNHEVLGYNAEEQLDGTVQNTISEVTINRPDGVLRVRRGFLSGSTVPPLRTPQGFVSPGEFGPFYLIDLDYYREQVTDFDPEFRERLSEYNRFMFRVFHWIIGEGPLWKSLRGEGVSSNVR